MLRLAVLILLNLSSCTSRKTPPQQPLHAPPRSPGGGGADTHVCGLCNFPPPVSSLAPSKSPFYVRDEFPGTTFVRCSGADFTAPTPTPTQTQVLAEVRTLVGGGGGQGCESLENPGATSVAPFVLRGGCSFAAKAKVALGQGHSMVVVGDRAVGDADADSAKPARMGGSDADRAGGGLGIEAVIVPGAAAEAISAALQETREVRFFALASREQLKEMGSPCGGGGGGTREGG